MNVYVVLRNLFHQCSVCEIVFCDMAQAITYCTTVAKTEGMVKERGKLAWNGIVDGVNIEEQFMKLLDR